MLTMAHNPTAIDHDLHDFNNMAPSSQPSTVGSDPQTTSSMASDSESEDEEFQDALEERSNDDDHRSNSSDESSTDQEAPTTINARDGIMTDRSTPTTHIDGDMSMPNHLHNSLAEEATTAASTLKCPVNGPFAPAFINTTIGKQPGYAIPHSVQVPTSDPLLAFEGDDYECRASDDDEEKNGNEIEKGGDNPSNILNQSSGDSPIPTTTHKDKTQDDEDHDLFEASFGKLHKRAITDDDDVDAEIRDDSDDEPVEVVQPPRKKARITAPSFEYEACEHTSGCDHTRSASTPPPTPRPGHASLPQATHLPVPGAATTTHDQNLSKPTNTTTTITKTPLPPTTRPSRPHPSPSLRYHTRLHTRALPLLPPNEPLAPHRYWISILCTTKTHSLLTSGLSSTNSWTTKHFLWLKGNRFTTMQTLWQQYHSMAAESGFELYLGREKVQMEWRVEECDFSGDRFVCLVAVGEGDLGRW